MKLRTQKRVSTLVNIVGVVSMYNGWGFSTTMFICGLFLCIVSSLHFLSISGGKLIVRKHLTK